MHIRRLALAGLAVSAFAFVGWEGRRALLAVLLRRGDFERLERWGGDTCFIPAARSQYSPKGKPGRCADSLAAWATHRFRSRFPVEKVMDLAWLPSDELILLLRGDPERGDSPGWREDARMVVLDLKRGETIVAES
ncbi:MAG TPA: hypothetical protein VKW04_00260, partial [Planctomycetota bacterium]|nr:hypothetical protein [Planctomycetota bacterium]